MTRKHPAQELEEDVLVRTSNMGQGRSDYEAFHTLSPAIHLREIHTHDFFELYIHLNGFPRLYVDNKIVTLQRGSLMIFPPFVMHGIISQDTIRNYERVVLFISSGMLHQLGQGLLPLEQRLLDCTRRTGYHYQLDEAALSLCTTCIDRVAQNTGDERPRIALGGLCRDDRVSAANPPRDAGSANAAECPALARHHPARDGVHQRALRPAADAGGNCGRVLHQQIVPVTRVCPLHEHVGVRVHPVPAHLRREAADCLRRIADGCCIPERVQFVLLLSAHFSQNSRHFADGFPAKSWQIAFALSNTDNFFPDISARFA